ncbi:MAG TPA: FGGY-family carbohydrate kinase [Aggregatilineaceae bacterium]|nr:FGGY-family carbohydrate kinase [Aggregatilineaceae bacterium]
MTARQDFLLGIDAGTSVVKAALFSPDGREHVTVARRTTLKAPHPTWAEVSMIETWEMTVQAIHEVLAYGGVRSDQIAAVGITGNMIGAWLVDGDGNPVRDAILWCDGRTGPLLDQLSEEDPGFMSRLYDIVGCAMQQGCTLPVLRWLAENEPQSLDRARHILCCKDWLILRLTGSIHLDPTEACVLPGDPRTRGYSEAMFDLLGVSAYRHLFPPLQPSEKVVGVIQREAAQLTGLKAGTPVVAGAGDVPASAIGVGAYEPGTACSLLGTNFLNCLVTDRPVFEPRGIGAVFCLPGERWLRSAINVSGTTSLDWAIEQFCQPEKTASASSAEPFAAVESLATNSPPGASGIIYLPYLSAQGITAPVVESAARAELFGLTNEHTRADLVRAVYEGLALSIRDCYEVIPADIGEIRLSGGAAKSTFFCQIVADVTGTRIVVPSGTEFGARGAALLAAVGIGWFETVADALSLDPTTARIYESNPKVKAVYDAVYMTYGELRDALRPVWRRNVQRLGQHGCQS